MAENKGTTGVTGTLDYDMAYRIFELVNAERAKAGVPALKLDADLQSAGMLRAAEISYKFEHIRPNGKICYSISSKVYAENICMNKGHADPAAKAMDIWMGSEAGHRDNILDPDFTIIGVGTFIASDGSYYFTQEFGYDAAKGSPVLSGEVTSTVAIDLGEPETEPATTGTTTAQTTTAPTTTTAASTTAVPTTAVPTTAVPTTAVPTTA
ncbi:MAG: CAP domain-containing protein, partial [Lachnospiraceae bacterium]|nr:CAP domain-containing protein [Lachnospiraceae bacterium]